MQVHDLSVNVRECLLDTEDGGVDDQARAVRDHGARWIRANGGYFGMDEDSANAMADSFAEGQ